MTDGERGRVFRGQGDNFFGSALHGLGDNPENPINPVGFAFNSPLTTVKVSVRNQHSSEQWYALYFHGRDTEGEIVEIVYRTDSGTDEKNGNSYTIFLGGGATDYNDGEWHDHELDLAGDMDVLRGTDPPLGIVNAFAVAQDEMDLLVDGFMLTEAAIGEHYWRTYQVVPGAGIGGVLGAYDSDAAEAVWHHYNDLGTLIATSDAAGETIHTAVPDFFGRPRYSVGTSPSAMGLNSKFYFDQTDLNYSNARWLDTERGRWTSPEPFGFDGPNLYHFVFNDPVNSYDPNGLLRIGPYGSGSTPGQWLNDFDAGSYDGLAGWKSGFLNAISFGIIKPSHDPCNPYQSIGFAGGQVSGIASLGAAVHWMVGAYSAAAGSGVATGSAVSAATRAQQINAAAANINTPKYTTIAVAETAQGIRVIASSEKFLRAAQMAALKANEIAVSGSGHAEKTAVMGARALGLTPTGVAASRPICSDCAQFLAQQSIKALSALR